MEPVVCVVLPFTAHPPVNHTKSKRNVELQANHLARLQQIIPSLGPTPKVDFELFWESSLPILTAMDMGFQVRVCRPDGSFVFPAVRDDAPADIYLGHFPSDRHVPGQWWERQASTQPRWPDTKQVRLAELYPFLRAFPSLARRHTLIAGIPAHEEGIGFDRWINSRSMNNMSAAQALMNLHQRGIKDVFIKVNLPKYLTTEVHLPDEMDAEEAERVILDALGYNIMSLEGYGDALLIQECVPMTKEYRCVVIGGEVRSGAGAVPSFTPLDRSSDQIIWDKSVLVRRSADTITELSDDEVSAYQAFANTATEKLGREGLYDYILDLAMVRSQPVAVELNPIVNWGWYANSVELVLRAIAEARPVGKDSSDLEISR